MCADVIRAGLYSNYVCTVLLLLLLHACHQLLLLLHIIDDDMCVCVLYSRVVFFFLTRIHAHIFYTRTPLLPTAF